MPRLLLVVALAAASIAQRGVAAQSWSDWQTPAGGEPELEYRYRKTVCSGISCYKDVMFRNVSRRHISFEYTIYAEGFRDRREEVKSTGSAYVRSDSSATYQMLEGGERITRVIVHSKKESSNVLVEAK